MAVLKVNLMTFAYRCSWLESSLPAFLLHKYWNMNTHKFNWNCTSSLHTDEQKLVVFIRNWIMKSVSLTSSCSPWTQCLLVCAALHLHHSDSQTPAHTHHPENKDHQQHGCHYCMCMCTVVLSQPAHLLDGPVWTLAAWCAVPAEVHCEVWTRNCSPHTLLPLLAWRTHPAISWHSNKPRSTKTLSVLLKTKIWIFF